VLVRQGPSQLDIADGRPIGFEVSIRNWSKPWVSLSPATVADISVGIRSYQAVYDFAW
jgi:hypothetical protein